MEKHRRFTVPVRIDGSLMREESSEYHTVATWHCNAVEKRYCTITTGSSVTRHRDL